jgi:hypothetical protein
MRKCLDPDSGSGIKYPGSATLTTYSSPAGFESKSISDWDQITVRTYRIFFKILARKSSLALSKILYTALYCQGSESSLK